MSDYEKFVRLVATMRKTQKDYFRHRSHDHLVFAMDAEKAVDAWIEQFDGGQKKLFGEANQ
jgi:hypothetical protein